MGLDAVWQQFAQVWAWLRYEVGIHPFIFMGVVIVIISAVIMYKAEIRHK